MEICRLCRHIIINKLHYADDQITKWKRQNKQVILIDTEGKTFSSPNSSIHKNRCFS